LHRRKERSSKASDILICICIGVSVISFFGDELLNRFITIIFFCRKESMSSTAAIDDNGWEETFVCKSPFDKLRLMGRHWPVKDGQTRAVVMIVHGSGEHCQRYRFMARFLNIYQIACVGFDMRGHGQSEGERGFAPRLDALHDDLECINEHIRNKLYPNIPVIIYSHGTGSLICLGHILRRPERARRYRAMIISTPSLCLQRRPTALLLFFARAFANLDPHFRLPLEGNRNNIYTNDPEIVEAYRNDPLVHDRWPAATIATFLELGLLLERRIVHAPFPILIQHGAADIITPIGGIRKWIRERVRGEVQFKEWPENYHEIHNDINKEEILDFAVHWIEEKLKI
jgi:alpha-beta hydrolase superfamily lysophospholipase